MRTSIVLVLGGTREAAEIAARLAEREGMRVISSLAGRTRAPKPLAGETRIGGFGGAEGLAGFLRAENVDTLVDATHPFAARISANAATAAQAASVRLLRLVRPAWRRQRGDDWREVASPEEAAAVLPAGAKALLALGSQHLGAFVSREDVSFVLRMVDPTESPPPLQGCEIVLGLPSPDPDEEEALLAARGVTHLVSRNSGGAGAYAKIEAARRLGLPVVMIARPEHAGAGETFSTVDALISAL